MWKSKYRCFVIKSRYICTKDNDLAEVYSSLKEAVLYPYADDCFGTLLRRIVDSLKIFARNRGLSGNDRYTGLLKNLTLRCDTYRLSDDEFVTAQRILMDCTYSLQELEELADKASPSVCPEGENREYDPRRKHREIRIRATHVTRDMSVRNTYDVDYYADIGQSGNMEGMSICLDDTDGGNVELVSVTEDAATLKLGEDEFHIRFGSEAKTKEYPVDTPYLSSDSLTLTFTYRGIPDYAGLWNMIASLGCDELEGKEDRQTLLARKKDILHFIDKTIERGNTGLYVAKALLTEHTNWGTCKINSISFFQGQLLKGIGQGCLAPDNRFGWEWMEVATRYNDPADFMEDMDLYYEVLDSAASHGVVEAIDIMDAIWEPEQIIEED